MTVTIGLRPTCNYHKDLLESTRMTAVSGGEICRCDGFYPVRELMPGRNQTGSSDGRYKYTSKERDVETGLD